MHLLFLFILPIITTVGAILREKGVYDFGKVNPQNAKWAKPVDQNKGGRWKFVIVDTVTPQEQKGSRNFKICEGVKKQIKGSMGEHLSLEEFDDPYKFDDHLLKGDDSRKELGGAIILRKITNIEADITEIDITIQHNGSEFCEGLLLRRVSQALVSKFAINCSMERERKRLANDEGFSTLSGDPFLTGMSCATLLPLVLFIQLILSEKEERVYLLMRLNGLRISSYYFTQAFWFTILYFFPFSIVFSAFSFVNTFRLFSAQGIILSILLLFNGIQLATLAVLFSAVFKRLTSALPLGLTLSSLMPIIQPLVSKLKLPEFTLFIPLFGYAQCFQTIVVTDRPFLSLIALPYIWKPILGIIINCIVFLLLAIYLGNVIDQNNSGITRPWHFLISDLFSSNTKKVVKKNKASQAADPELIDYDVKAEIERLDNNPEILKTAPLAFDHISKQFKGGKLAVEEVTFALESDQIFGLLGPNGAGKSTLMQIAGGMYHPSSGKVYISGLSSVDNPNLYYKSVGYCPQHDIYWRDLTVSEHLKFFEILRGSKGSNLEKKVKKGMAGVRLTNYAKALASSLSGGERRRLSLSMALSGDSKVVLLDEPTTGLDPKVRRMIWDIIGESRAGRLIILTTHSMEEAELLSQNLTIMAHGRLRCLGTPDHLKQKFGGQIFINISSISGQLHSAIEGVKTLLPNGTSISVVHESSDGANARLLFNGTKLDLLQLMMPLLENKQKIGIESFGVNQSSLDDVFMNIVKEADADA